MTKYSFYIIFLLMPAALIAQSGSQSKLEGTVSFISSQNIYVKFDNTDGITVGDTLFIKNREKLSPVIVVKHLSSKSVSGTPTGDQIISKGDKIIAIVSGEKGVEEKSVTPAAAVEMTSAEWDYGRNKNQIRKSFSGRLSVNSYTNFSNVSGWNSQRWRYRFSLNELEIADSTLRFDTYLTFSYKTDGWDLVKQDINNALRIYNLSLTYMPDRDIDISVGRKINRSASSLGSYDGFDFQYRFGNNKAGIIAGSRPDRSDYSFNFNLFEVGAYFNRVDLIYNSRMENTLGVFEQQNNGNTDRRFLYFQHSNNSITNITMFFSSEIDLYKKVNGVEENTFSLTSLYFNARYSPVRSINLSASYDTRKNIIYYETFKSYADSLLEAETRQGFRFRLNIRPANKIITGISFGYSSRGESIQPSTNYNIFLTYTQLPGVQGSLSANYTRLNTNYVDGNLFGVSLFHDLISGLSNFTLGYRYVSYQYTATDYELKQQIASAGIYINLIRSLTLTVSYEGIFESTRTNSALFAGLNIRF